MPPPCSTYTHVLHVRSPCTLCSVSHSCSQAAQHEARMQAALSQVEESGTSPAPPAAPPFYPVCPSHTASRRRPPQSCCLTQPDHCWRGSKRSPVSGGSCQRGAPPWRTWQRRSSGGDPLETPARGLMLTLHDTNSTALSWEHGWPVIHLMMQSHGGALTAAL